MVCVNISKHIISYYVILIIPSSVPNNGKIGEIPNREGLLRPKSPKGWQTHQQQQTKNENVPDKSGEGIFRGHWFASWSNGCRAGTNITWIKGDGWIKRVTLGRPTNLGRIRINILWIQILSMFHLYMLSWVARCLPEMIPLKLANFLGHTLGSLKCERWGAIRNFG